MIIQAMTMSVYNINLEALRFFKRFVVEVDNQTERKLRNTDTYMIS